VPDNCHGTFPHILCSVVLKPHLVAWKPGEYFCHVSRACMLRQSKQGTMCLPPFWYVWPCSRTSEPVNLHVALYTWVRFLWTEMCCLSGGNGISSEYVRQELRAVVGARTQQQSASGGGGAQSQGVRQQLQLGQQVSPTDLDSLGSLAFEIPTSGEWWLCGNCGIFMDLR
jgi:hypothetical protein